jgi:hypothetical protein
MFGCTTILCKAYALTHATRQLARIGGFVSVEADQIDSGNCALANLDFRQPQRLQSELDVFQHGEPRKKCEALEHHGNAGRRSIDAAAVIHDRASAWLCQACNQAQQRGFSRARASEQAHDLSFR